MKFGQLIKYNMRNIFVEKSYTKRAREKYVSPDPFLKNSKLSISVVNSLKGLYSLFLLYANQRDIEI